MNADFKIFNASRYNEPKELLKFIVEENGDPSKYCNGMGSTALMAACEWGNIKCVKILLQHNADIHAVSATFRNALMTCCFYGKYKCAKALIKYGAKLDEVNKRGWTALMFACAFLLFPEGNVCGGAEGLDILKHEERGGEEGSHFPAESSKIRNGSKT